MTIIDLQGVVGHNANLDDLLSSVEAAGDFTLRVHSPGGEIFDGIRIYNAIRDHRRAGYKVTAQISGLAASMATYIAMAADRVEIEDNAVWMIHNPWTIAIGDNRVMEDTASQLESLSQVLAVAYSKKTKRDVDVIRAEMDDETWLYGQQIIDAGYADAMIPAGDGAEDEATAMAIAKTEFGAMRQKLRDTDRASRPSIAALLPHTAKEVHMSTEKTAAANPEPQEKQDITPDETVDVREAVQAAIRQERDRVAYITARTTAAGFPQIAQSLIDSGASAADTDRRIVDEYVASGGPETRRSNAPEEAAPTSASVIADINAKLLKQIGG